MAAGDLVVADDQWEFRSLLLGATTSYGAYEWNGFDSSPVRRSPIDRIQSNGVILPTIDYLTARDLLLRLKVRGTVGSDLNTKLANLATATEPSTTGDEPLVYRVMGVKRRINCRPTHRQVRWDLDARASGLVFVDLEFYAQDPRIYTDSTTSTVLA